MEDWGKFNQTSLFEKLVFYSHLNKEDIISDANYAQKKFVKSSNLGEYHDLYV